MGKVKVVYFGSVGGRKKEKMAISWEGGIYITSVGVVSVDFKNNSYVYPTGCTLYPPTNIRDI